MHLDFVRELTTSSLFLGFVSFKSPSVYFDCYNHIILANFKRVSTHNASSSYWHFGILFVVVFVLLFGFFVL